MTLHKDKSPLDATVADITGVPQKTVTAVTRVFLEEIMRRVAKTGEVHLPGFGVFKIMVRHGKRSPPLYQGKQQKRCVHDKQYVVFFRKSQNFKKLVLAFLKDEETMDKLAVEEDVDQEELEKRAEAGCPECGKELERHGKTLICPVHGSEPFEPTR